MKTGYFMTEVKKKRIFSLAVFLVTVLWFAVFAVARIDMHHDAVMLKPAIDVAAGKIIFRDTFCQYGALAVWLQALAVKLFGGELIVIQLLTVLFYGGIAVLSDLVFRRFLSFPFRLVNLGLFWGMAPFYVVPFHPWSSVYALFFMLLSTEFLLRFLDRERWFFPALAGVSAACAFLARHPCGVVSFLAGAAALALSSCYLRSKWRHLGFFAAGFVALLTLFSLYLSLAGAWSDYIRQCFGFVGGFAFERGGGSWGEMTGRFFPVFDGLFPFDVFYSFLPLVCVAAGVAAFLRMTRDEVPARRRTVGFLTVVLAALASWHQYYPVPCVRHLYWAAIPMFGVFAFVCEKLWRATSRRRQCRVAAAALFVMAALPVGARLYFGALPFLRGFGDRRSVDLPGVRHLQLSSGEYALLEGLRCAYGELPPGIRERGVFNHTPDAVLSVAFPETGFRHPMFVNWKGDVYRDYPALALSYILKHRPPVVSAEELSLPGYVPVFGGELYGRRYIFYAPRY